MLMLYIGGARHAGLVRDDDNASSSFPSEFLAVGGWLTHGDLVLKPNSNFLAIAGQS